MLIGGLRPPNPLPDEWSLKDTAIVDIDPESFSGQAISKNIQMLPPRVPAIITELGSVRSDGTRNVASIEKSPDLVTAFGDVFSLKTLFSARSVFFRFFLLLHLANPAPRTLPMRCLPHSFASRDHTNEFGCPRC